MLHTQTHTRLSNAYANLFASTVRFQLLTGLSAQNSHLQIRKLWLSIIFQDFILIWEKIKSIKSLHACEFRELL